MSASNTVTKEDLKNIINAIFPATTDDMTQAQIDAFVASLDTAGIHAVDYPIAQSLNDTGWSYIKWNSGKLECWYKGNPGAYTVGTARGNWYSGGDLTFTYPVAFAYAPTINGNVSLGTSAYVVMFQFNGFSNTTCQGRIVAGSSIAQNSNYWIFIHAVGRWK